jgi:hypothetical protein
MHLLSQYIVSNYIGYQLASHSTTLFQCNMDALWWRGLKCLRFFSKLQAGANASEEEGSVCSAPWVI